MAVTSFTIPSEDIGRLGIVYRRRIIVVEIFIEEKPGSVHSVDIRC